MEEKQIINIIDSPSAKQDFETKINKEGKLQNKYDELSQEETRKEGAKEIERFKLQAKETAIQATRAAIMSRNMSHNLGSHVMAYLKQQFNSKEEIRQKWGRLPDELVSYLIGMGKFIGYLQERQDYIATVSTTYIPISTPVDFKDAIFDCLNHDLKSERHPTVDDSTNLLLSYIALSEGYHRNEKNKPLLNIVFEKEDRKIVTGHDFLEKNRETEASVDDIRSFEFSLPSGLVGRQALFSIIENLIRNAAKHEQQSNDTLDIRLSICDGEEIDHFWCFKDDSMNDYFNEQFSIAESLDISDLSLFTISYKSSQKGDNMKDLVRQLREGMSKPYVNDDNIPDENNKGLKEVRISASWLRGNYDETEYLGYSKDNNYSLVKTSNKKAPLVYITGNKDTGDLYFTIFLKKCLELAYLPEGMSDIDIEHFRKNGWKELSSKDELKSTDFTFEHIIVANDELYDELRPYSSNRLTCWEGIDDEMRSFLKENDWKKDSLLRVIHSLHTGIPITPNETIYIWDSHSIWDDSENPKKQTVEEGDLKLVIRTNEEDEEQTKTAEYVYREHHDSNKNLRPFLNCQMLNRYKGEGYYSQIKFVEGISGGDSTHRLVRHVDLSVLWYYSHLYAMKKRVAIFDERLFKSVHDVSEAEALERCKKPVFTENELSRNSRSVLFDQKGVHVFSLIQEKNESNAPVWAIVGCIINWENRECCYRKFANVTVSLDGTRTVVCEKFVDDNDLNFDYISIHQSLLEKLYESFHFMDKGSSGNDEVNEKGKFSITNEIYHTFIETHRTIRMKEDKDYFVYNTNLFIHSGRGSISHDYMPQPQPFIQYSAIQHAVFDCKYTLIELLDYSKYIERK